MGEEIFASNICDQGFEREDEIKKHIDVDIYSKDNHISVRPGVADLLACYTKLASIIRQ